MSILIYAEASNGKLKKPTFEVASYGVALGKTLNMDVTAVIVGNITETDAKVIEKYGVNKVIIVSNSDLNQFGESSYSSAIASIAEKLGTTILVLTQTYNSRAIAPRLAIKLDASLLSGVTTLAKIESNGYSVSRSAYSGKALQELQSVGNRIIITLKPNSFTIVENNVNASISTENYQPTAKDLRLKTKQVIKNSEKISLTEADVVVSAGRGLKGPENWGMIEELAETLKAATACSKPVADVHWRPHNEHVGQTGIQIAPNVYIAIGISGAIQHLAGVNSSKTIIVINKDPEAPFFKAADYGIVGDAFTVIPELNKALKARFSQN